MPQFEVPGLLLPRSLNPLAMGGLAMRRIGAELEPIVTKYLKQPSVRDLRQRQPVVEATVASEWVAIGNKMNHAEPDRDALLAAGHKKLVMTLLDSHGLASIPDEVTAEVLDITLNAGTEPLRLAPEHITPIRAHVATNLIDNRERFVGV